MYYFVEGVSGAGKSTFVNSVFHDKDIIVEGDIVKPLTFIDGKSITIENYKKLHKEKLKALYDIKSSKNVVVVGGLLHVVEYDLVGVYNFDKQKIIQYFRDIITCVPDNSQIVYLETTNIVENTKNILKERYLTRPEWIRGIFDYIDRVSYCQKMDWHGEEGFVKLMEMIYDCEKSILQEIKIEKKILVRKI